MKTKEQVKQNKLTIADALNLVSPGSKTYGWLLRRSERLRRGAK